MAGVLQLLARAAGKQSRRTAATFLAPPLQRPTTAAASSITPQNPTGSSRTPTPLQLLSRAAGKQSRRAATLSPRAATFLAPPLERPIAAAILPGAPRLLAPVLQRFVFAPLLPDGSDDHARVRAGEADTVAGSVAPNRSRLALAILITTTGAKGGGFPFSVGHRDAQEPGGAAEGGGDYTHLVVVGVDSAHYCGAMLCVEDAALGPCGAAFLAPPLERPISLPSGSDDHVWVRAREADTVAGGAAPNRSCLALAVPITTGAQGSGFAFAMGGGDSAFLVVDSAYGTNGDYGGAMLCVEDAALGPRGAAFLGPPLECPMAAAAAAAILSASRVLLVPTHPRLFVALLLPAAGSNGLEGPKTENRARVGAKEAAAVAGAAPNGSRFCTIPTVLGITGRRGYSSTAGGNEKSGGQKSGGDDESLKPRLQNQSKIMAKLAKLQFHVRRIETCVYLHVKFSLLVR